MTVSEKSLLRPPLRVKVKRGYVSDYYQVWIVRGCQSFPVGFEKKEENARWYARMLRKALKP